MPIPVLCHLTLHCTPPFCIFIRPPISRRWKLDLRYTHFLTMAAATNGLTTGVNTGPLVYDFFLSGARRTATPTSTPHIVRMPGGRSLLLATKRGFATLQLFFTVSVPCPAMATVRSSCMLRPVHAPAPPHSLQIPPHRPDGQPRPLVPPRIVCATGACHLLLRRGHAPDFSSSRFRALPA